MSTQHPDNAHQPFFVEDTLIGGEDEIQEAYYAYSHLGCDEQMWDFEGKEVDNFVVKKLLTKNEQFFRERTLGKDVFLTVRVPNPEFEAAEGKILLETLESIPRSYDAAKLFYGDDIAPIYEVILPMTTSAASLNRIFYYYRDMVAGKEDTELWAGDITIGKWIGQFNPKTINVIPLFEDMEHMLNAATILREYLSDKQLAYQRVFLARSDPAVNYGSIGAVLINKIALQRLWQLSEEIGIPIYPILGAGSAPFRGNLRPETVQGIVKGYPSVQTYTIQSSFKFDSAPAIVQQAIHTLNTHERSAPVPIDEDRTIDIINRYAAAYKAQVQTLAPVINQVAQFIPKRRKRKLHIGLFGYSRKMNNVTLPRAITFTAALYSIGLPPELLGLNALTDEDMTYIRSVYTNVDTDLRDAYRFFDPTCPFVPEELTPAIARFCSSFATDETHQTLVAQVRARMNHPESDDAKNAVLQAAKVRGFLG